MLCDTTIRLNLDYGFIAIDPEPEDCAFQPASVDLRLGTRFRNVVASPEPQPEIVTDLVVLHPGSCMLACTRETVRLGRRFVARVEGKSTWGRRFLMVHSTAGFIDPGFEGQITLELVNLGPAPLTLRTGQYIAQISFDTLDQAAARPYGHPALRSHYMGQRGAVGPRS